ncbi:hypothetical protein fugu_015046 [Takifugu bimaculatus]|uniref:Uncharacterized protein n=1 Tax=Takifugu bimaculatus TaxID=433685 RepID=A0A4Z2BZL3_9TELE|nr:hypothetical protein fugu_015046 [Takifugu bimaculatus]
MFPVLSGDRCYGRRERNTHQTVMSVGHLVGDSRKCNPSDKKLQGKTSPIRLLSFFITVTTQKHKASQKRWKRPRATDGSDHELNINPSVSCLPEEPTVVSALLPSRQSVITQSVCTHTKKTPGITGRHGNDAKKGNGVVMVTNPERRLNPCLAVWLPPSPRLQTGLGQTAGGAEEKPGHEIYTSLPLTSAPDQRPRQNNHVLKPQVSEHECLGPKPAE